MPQYPDPGRPLYCARCAAPLGEQERGGVVRPACSVCGWVYYAKNAVGAAVLLTAGNSVLLVQATMPRRRPSSRAVRCRNRSPFRDTARRYATGRQAASNLRPLPFCQLRLLLHGPRTLQVRRCVDVEEGA